MFDLKKYEERRVGEESTRGQRNMGKKMNFMSN